MTSSTKRQDIGTVLIELALPTTSVIVTGTGRGEKKNVETIVTSKLFALAMIQTAD